jgi:hypothetical protein
MPNLEMATKVAIGLIWTATAIWTLWPHAPTSRMCCTSFLIAGHWPAPAHDYFEERLVMLAPTLCAVRYHHPLFTSSATLSACLSGLNCVLDCFWCQVPGLQTCVLSALKKLLQEGCRARRHACFHVQRALPVGMATTLAPCALTVRPARVFLEARCLHLLSGGHLCAGTYYDDTLVRAIDPITPRCQGCSPGTYSNGRVAAVGNCYNCRAGTFSSAPRASACAPCAAGTFSSIDSGATACVGCWAGAYCPEGASSPTWCASGSFLSIIGGTAQSDCTICPAGSSCRFGATAHTPCAPGTVAGSAGLDQCVNCAAGTFQDIGGNTPLILHRERRARGVRLATTAQWALLGRSHVRAARTRTSRST